MPDQKLDFNDIHAKFHSKIRRYLARRVGEPDADDLTQAVFIKVSQGLIDFRGEASLATWIYRIAANIVTDKLRSVRYSIQVDSLTDNLMEGMNIKPDETQSVIDRNLIRKEMNECIRGIVDRLPDQSRAVIKLSEIEELKNSEIAERLGTTLENVKIRLHRARKRLKEDMNAQCRLYRDDRNELACDPKHCI